MSYWSVIALRCICMLVAAFWLLAGLIVYVYFGYPLLLRLVRMLRGRAAAAIGMLEPSVTMVISAYNEETSIGEKLRNSLQLDYPADRLEIVVVSDASTDRTDEIVQRCGSARIRLLRMQERGGKTVGLNCAVRESRGDIVVFSDANALYHADALRMLVRNFADPTVGGVVGEATYVDARGEAERSEGLYWKYETGIKKLESDVGSVVGGDGAIYAVRKTMYWDMRADALSDFVNPLQIVEQGYRVIYEPAARSYERAGDDFGKEFQRKVRIVNRAWRATFSMPQMLNPLRFGFFSIQLISHKLLRWLVPALLVALLVVSAFLAPRGGIYALALWVQAGFYGLALVGWALQKRPQLPKAVSIPYFFCLVNVASFLGIIDAFRGKTYTVWTTVRANGQ